MKILICSDGTSAAENAIEVGALLAGPLKAEISLFGIAEKSQDASSLRETLQQQAQPIRSHNVPLNIIVHAGEPIREILDRTSQANWSNRAILALRKDLRTDQGNPAPGARGNRRM